MEKLKIGDKVYNKEEKMFGTLVKVDDIEKEYVYVTFLNRQGQEECKKVLIGLLDKVSNEFFTKYVREIKSKVTTR
ncbi:hypothetical protein ACN077_03200 [Clostridium chromiireducens]|uniref:hypothetical protein n=1 Tax=Clostridium chromiireducens TaxID=225345 RepID=UPI003AF53D0B